MNELDDSIRRELNSQAQHGAIDLDRELPMRTQIAETFRGRFRWLAWLAAFYRIVILIVAVIAAMQFFRVEETRELIAYATLFVICVFASAFIKLWYWMLLMKNSIIRETKRLELQVAELTRDLGSTNTMQ